MPITQLGLHGPQRAYPGFVAKAQALVTIHAIALDAHYQAAVTLDGHYNATRTLDGHFTRTRTLDGHAED